MPRILRLLAWAALLAVYLATCCSDEVGCLELSHMTWAPQFVGAVAAAQQDEPIDFNRARQLLRRQQQGEKLTEEEAAYLQRAIVARRRQRGRQSAEPQETTGLKPLTEMTADEKYEGEDGGLYGEGRNEPPAAHREAAERALARIQPRNADGEADPNGQIVFVSISMSNATQEFSRFKQLADVDEDKSSRLVIVDCAQGGQAMAEWVDPKARPWQEADRRISSARVSAKQVQVAWIKLANKGPQGSLEEHGKKLQRDTLAVIHNAKARFPNLQIAYLSSRIYGGYATSPLNPEPYAYESAFVVRWLIQDQMSGESELSFDASQGRAEAPLLLWGPYMWADGTTPRAGDHLAYERADLANDGTHPSEQGRDKIARLMLTFFKENELTAPWFTGD